MKVSFTGSHTSPKGYPTVSKLPELSRVNSNNCNPSQQGPKFFSMRNIIYTHLVILPLRTNIHVVRDVWRAVAPSTAGFHLTRSLCPDTRPALHRGQHSALDCRCRWLDCLMESLVQETCSRVESSWECYSGRWDLGF